MFAKKNKNKKELSEEEQNERQDMLNELTGKFNFVIMSMIDYITRYYDDLNITKMKICVDEILKNSPKEPISYFLLHVYTHDKYRKNILLQNDKFFIDQKYEDITNGEENKMAQLFEFKNLWKQIDDDTKKYIKKSMMALVKISQKYVLLL